MVFVDSNIPMYVAGKPHPNRDPARRFLEQVQAGVIDACSSTEVLQEILFRYAGLRRVDLAARVYDLFVSICPTVLPVTLADTDRAKDLLVRSGGGRVSARDAVHAAVMMNHGVEEIATFDGGFDQIEGVRRLALL